MRRTDHSSRGVLLSVCVCDREASIMRSWSTRGGGCCAVWKRSSQAMSDSDQYPEYGSFAQVPAGRGGGVPQIMLK